MPPVKLSDGTILVPTRAEGPNGIVGDSMLPLTPEHPLHKEWCEWLAANPDAPREAGS